MLGIPSKGVKAIGDYHKENYLRVSNKQSGEVVTVSQHAAVSFHLPRCTKTWTDRSPDARRGVLQVAALLSSCRQPAPWTNHFRAQAKASKTSKWRFVCAFRARFHGVQRSPILVRWAASPFETFQRLNLPQPRPPPNPSCAPNSHTSPCFPSFGGLSRFLDSSLPGVHSLTPSIESQRDTPCSKIPSPWRPRRRPRRSAAWCTSM